MHSTILYPCKCNTILFVPIATNPEEDATRFLADFFSSGSSFVKYFYNFPSSLYVRHDKTIIRYVDIS